MSEQAQRQPFPPAAAHCSLWWFSALSTTWTWPWGRRPCLSRSWSSALTTSGHERNYNEQGSNPSKSISIH